MILLAKCKWCGVSRRWREAREVQGAIVADSPDGMHTSYDCLYGPSGLCEPSSRGDRMVKQLAALSRRRMRA